MRRAIVMVLGLVSGMLFASEPVDLNRASAEEIAKALHGVGLKRAEQIVAYREQFGPIHTPEELLVIKGIGPKTLEKNRALMMTELVSPRKSAIGLDAAPANH